MTINVSTTETNISVSISGTTVSISVASAPVVTSLTISELQTLVIPMGEISYFSIVGTAAAIAAQSDGSTNMIKAAPVTMFDGVLDFDNGGADNGRLRYTGAVTKMFHIACTVSYTIAAAAQDVVIGIGLIYWIPLKKRLMPLTLESFIVNLWFSKIKKITGL